MFAHNNEKIDYFTIALINTLMIRKNLGVGVTLITDNSTVSAAKIKHPVEMLQIFDNIILADQIEIRNRRVYRDTAARTESMNFLNSNRWSAYDYSPYEETLVIDADYLIMSNQLNHCWGSVHDIMISSNIQEVCAQRENSQALISDFSIRMYWATVIYFRKSFEARRLFDIVKDVANNYNYYKLLYSFPNAMFRNDWAFSIAVHKLGDFQNDNQIARLPVVNMLKSFDRDDIACVNGVNDITLLVQNTNSADHFNLARVVENDVHIMNKYSILRHEKELIKLYKD